MGTRITAIGYEFPPFRISNTTWRSEFATKHELMSNEFTRFISEGIEQRYYWAPGTRVADVGARAAADCLRRADFAPERVEHILHLSNVGDAFVNGDGPKIQHLIGAVNASAFDITGLACSGFVVLLSVAASLIESKRYDNVLLTCVANPATRAADHRDVAASSLGDLSVAVLVERTDDGSGLVSYCHETRGQHYELHRHKLIPDGKRTWDSDKSEPWGEHFFYIDPTKGVVASRQAAQEFIPGTARKALERASMKVSDMRWFVSHQPGTAPMKVWEDVLGIDSAIHPNTLAEIANSSSCTVPFTLARMLERQEIDKGDHLLLLAPGSGHQAASAVWRW